MPCHLASGFEKGEKGHGFGSLLPGGEPLLTGERRRWHLPLLPLKACCLSPSSSYPLYYIMYPCLMVVDFILLILYRVWDFLCVLFRHKWAQKHMKTKRGAWEEGLFVMKKAWRHKNCLCHQHPLSILLLHIYSLVLVPSTAAMPAHTCGTPSSHYPHAFCLPPAFYATALHYGHACLCAFSVLTVLQFRHHSLCPACLPCCLPTTPPWPLYSLHTFLCHPHFFLSCLCNFYFAAIGKHMPV